MTGPTLAIENVPNAVHVLDAELGAAIEKAAATGIPQAYIVALLHVHALQQTQRVLDNSES